MDARLAAVKRYCKIDYDEDDELLAGLLAGADAYLEGAGCVREGHEALYDIIAHAMVLEQYEGRCVDNAAQALQSVPPIARQMLTQLKLVCSYEGGDADGDTGQ